METKRQRYDRRHAALKAERSSWLNSWVDLADYFLPRQARFLNARVNDGRKVNGKIIDPTATRSIKILGSGMKAGLTSEFLPWFNMGTEDPDFNEWRPAKIWLSTVRDIMSRVFIKSNIYGILPGTYRGGSTFGTDSWFLQEDAQGIIRGVPMPIGSYCLATSHRGVVDTCYREFSMTARQMVKKFGEDRCSANVLRLASNHGQDTWVKVIHVVEPNPEFDPQKLESRFKAWVSDYYEEGGTSELMLAEEGYDEFPVMASRWDVNGEDIYGGSLGMDGLGDVKQLQLMSRRKGQLVDKLTNPPMNAPSSMQNRELSVLPGAINFHDVMTGQQGFTPTYQVDPHLNDLRMDLAELRDRIKQNFHEDLFLLISNDDRSNITATEILARKEEKIQVLGPTLTRYTDELLDPMIGRTYGICNRRGMFPPPPPELVQMGLSLTVDYTSILIQALKMSGFSATQQALQVTGTLAGAFPEVLDNIDSDVVLEDVYSMLGTNPRYLRDPKKRDAIRQGRAQEQQAQQALQMAQAGATTAQTLANTPVTDPSALTAMLQQMRGA